MSRVSKMVYACYTIHCDATFNFCIFYEFESFSQMTHLLDLVRRLDKLTWKQVAFIILHNFLLLEPRWRAAESTKPVWVCGRSVCQRAAEGPAPGPITAGQDPWERGQQYGMALKTPHYSWMYLLNRHQPNSDNLSPCVETAGEADRDGVWAAFNPSGCSEPGKNHSRSHRVQQHQRQWGECLSLLYVIK